MLRAVNYMIGHHSIDTDRLGLYARSMGGRVAMTMANENSGGFDRSEEHTSELQSRI